MCRINGLLQLFHTVVCLASLFTVLILDGLPVFRDRSGCAIAGHLWIPRCVKSQTSTDLGSSCNRIFEHCSYKEHKGTLDLRFLWCAV